jgi:hypothetical protein
VARSLVARLPAELTAPAVVVIPSQDEVTLYWQAIYVDALNAYYNQPGGVAGGGSYSGLNILGTVQAAGGVTGASTGAIDM